MAHQAGAYPSFHRIKRLGILLLPPGWDASPLQGYPQHSICRYPFIHLGGERRCESLVSCPGARAPIQTSRSGVERTNHRPPRLHILHRSIFKQNLVSSSGPSCCVVFFGKTRAEYRQLLVISICRFSLQKKPSARISLSADHEVRLETLEHQLTRLIHNTVSLSGAYVLSISLNL